MRDITKIINHLMTVVIPKQDSTVAVHNHLEELAKLTCYLAPEQQQGAWDELETILISELGPPNGLDWKERVGRVMRNEEQLPIKDENYEDRKPD